MSSISNFADRPGTIKNVNFAQPSAGAEQILTVPSGKRWRVISLHNALITSAAAANRQVSMNLKDDTGAVVAKSQAIVNHAASLTKQYDWSNGVAVYTSIDVALVNGPLPVGVFLLASWVITTQTTNIQSGDQFLQGIVLVEEWSSL